MTAQDAQMWASLIPVVGNGVASVIGLFKLMRRSRGEPEEQPGDEAAAQAILAAVRAETAKAVEDAKDPWEQLRALAENELRKGV